MKRLTIANISAFLAKPHILFYVLPWLMVLLVWGTLAQSDMGLYEAQTKFFSSWIYWWGPVPLPGGLAAITVIFINLLFKFLFKSHWSPDKIGINITHLGVLLLILGGLLTALSAREGYVILPEGETSAIVFKYDPIEERVLLQEPPLFTLPFTITLDDFIKEVHPGTDMAKSYHSDIVLNDGYTQWPVRIEMNAPLRFKGYTLYQSSYNDEGAEEITILSVVWNFGRLFPYFASVIIGFGLLVHIAMQLRVRAR